MIYSSSPAYDGSLRHTLFSFKGRSTRFDYWLKGFIPAKVIFILPFLIPFPQITTPLCLTAFILSFWITIAVGVKRFHDRGIAGGYILFSFVPIANLIVILQLGFFDGNYGANFYGQDPKGRSPIPA